MTSRPSHHRLAALVLGSTALVTITALPSASFAGPDGTMVLAQAPNPDPNKKPPPKAGPAPVQPRPAAPPPPRPPAPTVQPRTQAPPPPRPPAPTAQPRPVTPPPPQAPAVTRTRPTPPPTSPRPTVQPAPPPAATTTQRPATIQQPPGTQRPAITQQPGVTTRPPGQPPGRQPTVQDRRPPTPPTAQQPPRGPAAVQQQPLGAPAAGQPLGGPAPGQQHPPVGGPAAAQPQPSFNTPGSNQPIGGAAPGQQRPAVSGPAAAQPQPSFNTPGSNQPIGSPAPGQRPPGTPAPAIQANPAVVAPPTQTRDSREFIRRDNQQPAPHIDQLRHERHETREGNRVFIREPDRTIIREGDRTIIRHNETGRFAVGARNVVVERRGIDSETIIERGNGVRIINITDADGRLLRRVRRDPGGREIVIIDNSYAMRRPAPLFVQLPPPVIRIPRERYILDLGVAAVAAAAAPAAVYGVLMEPPVEAIAEPYTLDQVRFSAPLRDRMPRVDLDINFDTGSWQLTPDQVDRLAVIADAINRAVQANPREVFMIEGHTDAVGNDVDNLSLSDRRAEAVAVALTEQFQVPAENLVTQGYGEQYLKVPTQGPERANRRVAVRRITPLLDQQAGAAPPPR